MISVVDYGVVNLNSIINMLNKLGLSTEVVNDISQIERAKKLILPGVGTFDEGINELRKRGFAQKIIERVNEYSVPLLGICLGMQLLGDSSEEGKEKGLGLIHGYCKRFLFDNDVSLKIPHMGWNKINVVRENLLFDNLTERTRFYFTHSYHFRSTDPNNVIAYTNYGYDFPSIISLNNIWGVQFHPEKSHSFGMELLSNFSKL